MAISNYPEPGQPKKFPVGATGSFTYLTSLDSGVYTVKIAGDDTFAAATNGLTVTNDEAGYVLPVSMDVGDGVVTLPFNNNSTINAASISVPNVIEFEKVTYEQGDEPSGISVSFDSAFSGSYVVDMTIPGNATEAYAYYSNGNRQTLGTSFPASITSPTFDTAAALAASAVSMGFAYADDKSILSKGNSTSQAYPTPVGAFATGGTVYTSGGYRYHKFTANGTLSVIQGGDVEYVVVAGGGGGGSCLSQIGGGGGGAGGFISASTTVTSGSIAITIGAGGAAVTNNNGLPGNASEFLSASAVGGGRGGRADNPGGNGGSGGGAGGFNGVDEAAGLGTAGQGFNGEAGSGSDQNGQGGGGAGEAGGTDGNKYGGDGSNSASAWATATSSGVSGYFAGGGGGGGLGSPIADGGPGGDGGGGNGGRGDSSPNATAGTVNTGGGGGGAGGYRQAAAGGSGIVLIRYAV